MRDDVFQRNPVLPHEVSRELGCAGDGCCPVVAGVLAHFDADAVVVSGAVKICVLALLVGWQVLHARVVLNGKVPRQVSNSISTWPHPRSELAIVQRARMPPGVSSRRVILRAVDGNVSWIHRPILPSSVAAFRDKALVDIQFAVGLCRTGARRRGTRVPGIPAAEHQRKENSNQAERVKQAIVHDRIGMLMGFA